MKNTVKFIALLLWIVLTSIIAISLIGMMCIVVWEDTVNNNFWTKFPDKLKEL